MMLTTKGRYAVMAMVELHNNLQLNRPTALHEISSRQGISLDYLEQIFLMLRKNNLVKSIKGPKGGYILAVDPATITISNIMDAVGEPIKIMRCSNDTKSGCMAGKARCTTHNLWEGLGNTIYAYLDSVSLKNVCDREI
jgi:Rrf2 family transcriptional regulator, iron-sulfur cluster assembly transcription factor